MRANRTDGNHKQIVAHFRSLGFHVLDISSLKNCCDLVVSGYGHTFYVEVKDGEKPQSARRLTPGETVFMNAVNEATGWWYLVESEQDVNQIYADLFANDLF